MKMRPTIAGLLLWPLASPAAEERVMEAEIELGAGYLDDSYFRYGKYSGLVDEGLELIADFRLDLRPARGSEDTGHARLEGTRLGFDSRRLDGEIGLQGSQRLRASYQQTPRNRFEDGRTPFIGVGGNRLRLPEGWEVSDASTTSMTTLEENLLDFSERGERREARLEYRLHFAGRWRLDAGLRRQIEDGRETLAGTFGSNGGNSRAALLPAQVDQETDTFDVSLMREGDGHLLGLAWHGSFFRNEDRALEWQNPFGAQPDWQPGAEYPEGFGRLARVPDNDFQQLRLFGRMTLGTGTRASFDLARGRMRQDEAFLPYSVDPELAPVPLPRGDLEGEVDTTLAQLRISSRPLRRLSLTGHARYQERDNDTPRDTWLYVSGDATPQVAPESGRVNRPYSLIRREAGLAAAWRLPQRTRLQVGYEYRDRERDFSEVNDSREQVFSGGIHSRRFELLSVGLDFSHARRRIDDYVGNRPYRAGRVPGSVEPEAFENHPNLRRYYLASRDRDRLQLRADLHPTEAFYLGAAFAWNRDDYRADRFGLDESRLRSWMLDAGYVPNDTLRLTALYHHDRYRSDQDARSFNFVPATRADPDRDWSVETRDTHETWGLSLDLEDLPPLLGRAGADGRGMDLRLEYSDSRSRGRIGVETGPALAAADLPPLSTRLQTLAMVLEHHVSDAGRVRLALEHERYRSRDFALDGVAPDSVEQVLLFGETSPRYQVNWITLSYRHRF
jgi:MtrB/PioB family decaheme-associated outer membrane protein